MDVGAFCVELILPQEKKFSHNVIYPPTLSEAGRRVRVHFVYHLPEVIVRRSSLLVESRTGRSGIPGVSLAGLPNQNFSDLVF